MMNENHFFIMAMVMNEETHAKHQEIYEQYVLAECRWRVTAGASVCAYDTRRAIDELHALIASREAGGQPRQVPEAPGDSASCHAPIHQLIITADMPVEFTAQIAAMDLATVQATARAFKSFDDMLRASNASMYEDFKTIRCQLINIRVAHAVIDANEFCRLRNPSRAPIIQHVLYILGKLRNTPADHHIVILPNHPIKLFRMAGIHPPRTGADVDACIELANEMLIEAERADPFGDDTCLREQGPGASHVLDLAKLQHGVLVGGSDNFPHSVWAPLSRPGIDHPAHGEDVDAHIPKVTRSTE